MADLTPKTINELPEASSLSDSDVFALNSSGSAKKTLWSTLRDAVRNITGLDAASTIGDTDLFPLRVGSANKKLAYSTLRDDIRTDWELIGTQTGKTAIFIADISAYKDIYIHVYYEGYAIPLNLPTAVFSNTARTLAVSYATFSNVPYNGTVLFSNSAVQLGSFVDHTGTDVSASVVVSVYGRP